MTAGPMTSILDAIGDTALVELTRVAPAFDGRLFAKLEQRNPGGSVEDRSALAALRRLLEHGELAPGGTLVVETGSADFAVSLAQVCRPRQVQLVCVLDAAPAQRAGALLRAYGARVEVPAGIPDGAPRARAAYARELAARLGAHWPGAHAELTRSQSDPSTMREIVAQLSGRIDYVVCEAGAAAVLRGGAEHIAAGALPIRLIAVDVADGDPEIDAVTADVDAAFGAGRVLPGFPGGAEPGAVAVHTRLRVTAAQAAAACRRLVEREAILAGPRSGAALAAFELLAARIAPGAGVVLVFPDNGFRHLDTIHAPDSDTGR